MQINEQLKVTRTKIIPSLLKMAQESGDVVGLILVGAQRDLMDAGAQEAASLVAAIVTTHFESRDAWESLARVIDEFAESRCIDLEAQLLLKGAVKDGEDLWQMAGRLVDERERRE